MRIAIIGYGKMGHEIEKAAIEKQHSIPKIINIENLRDLNFLRNDEVDVAIEFTQPDSAIQNIKSCANQKIPIVVGTTGWYDRFEEVKNYVLEQNGTLFYASNFSIGVNLFFALNKYLAKIMDKQDSYSVSMEEIHHTQKLDSPSGTAITLAEGIIEHSSTKEKWANEETGKKEMIDIVSKRIENVPGTHSISYHSPIDQIDIKHTAFNRKGFAQGSVASAEWVQNKKGVYTMSDMLNFL
ncbi:MAG: 4-hydroxy-tetrahydrodipicolinate reductase [Bacteroidota bacterium]